MAGLPWLARIHGTVIAMPVTDSTSYRYGLFHEWRLSSDAFPGLVPFIQSSFCLM